MTQKEKKIRQKAFEDAIEICKGCSIGPLMDAGWGMYQKVITESIQKRIKDEAKDCGCNGNCKCKEI